jgi:DNA invertase Pin-like site-specific DNA recombinase
MFLDESLKPDFAVSAYRGKNRKTGNLAAFLNKIQTGEVPKGSALLLESLDRLSREELEESFDLLRSIVRAGVEVHTISDRQIYKKGSMDAQQMIMSIFVLARSNEESKRKSERCAAVAEQVREQARLGKPVTKLTPGWIKVKDDYSAFELVPEHAETIRTVYAMALAGHGANRICDHLIKQHRPAWTRKGRWSTDYVSHLLRTRQVIGEQRLGKCPRGMRRTEEGEPVANYFPTVIDEATWQSVQNRRANNWARGKLPVGTGGNRKGVGRTSWHNIFVGLVFDQDGNTVIYKQTNRTWEYLMSSDRSKFKERKIRYDHFKKAVLGLLTEINWETLIEEVNPQLRAELAEVEAALQKNTALLAKYAKLLEIDDDAPELLLKKIKTAEMTAKDLETRREKLLSRTASSDSLLTSNSVIVVNQTVREANLRLREEMGRRIERIDLTFGATVIGLDGRQNTVAKLTFVNGAIKWAVIDKDRAVLLS